MDKSEDELRDVLSQAAVEISRMYDNPRSWNSWMVYLLERLEQEATRIRSGNTDTFKEMLAALQDQVRNRLRTGGW